MCDPLERPSTYMAADQQHTKMPGSAPLPYLRKGDRSHVWSLIPQKKEPDKTTEKWAMSEAPAALREGGWREVSFFFFFLLVFCQKVKKWHGGISLHTVSLWCSHVPISCLMVDLTSSESMARSPVAAKCEPIGTSPIELKFQKFGIMDAAICFLLLLL